MNADRPPVVLIGRGVTALGALRCLSRRGLTVYTVCDDRLVPRSRYYRPAVTTAGKQWKCELGPEGLEMLAQLPLERAVIVPCADDFAMWVAELPQELGQRFPSSNASHAALTLLQDKRCFSKLCQQLAVPHPRCFLIGGLSDLEQVPFEDMPRAFFKPSNSIPFLKVFGVKGLWVTNRDEAIATWRQIQDADLEVLVQEYVQGGANDHYFIDGFRDRDGVIRATFARRRDRIYPLDFGNSSYCHQVPLESIEPAWAGLQRILDHVDYRGIFSAEFKRDSHDGQFKILEINTRVWVYVEFAAWCGVDVCQMAYEDALGHPVPNARITRPGAGCVDLYHDYCCFRSVPRSERPGFAHLVSQWFRSHKPVYSLSDPGPVLGWTIEALAGRLRRLGSGE